MEKNENKLLRTNTIKLVGRLTNVETRTATNEETGAQYVSVVATVQSNLGGKTNEFEVKFFANALTKENKPSQLFEKYSKMGELKGKKVQVDGNISENRFWSVSTSQISSAQVLNGRFIKGVVESTEDEASYQIGGFIVKSLVEKRNKKDEIYRYDLTIGQSNYNGDGMSALTLHIRPEDREIVSAVESYEVGQTVELNGSLNFTNELITVESNNEGGFGKAITKTFNNRQKNFFIEGGSAPVDDEDKGMYSPEVIKKLIEAYKAKDIEISSNGASKSGSASTNAPAVGVVKKQTSLI